jgi:hypothetical protein
MLARSTNVAMRDRVEKIYIRDASGHECRVMSLAQGGPPQKIPPALAALHIDKRAQLVRGQELEWRYFVGLGCITDRM